MIEGVDYAFSYPSEVELYAAGKRFAGRYIGPGSDAKHLHAAERDRILAAGLDIMLLVEGQAADCLLGRAKGIEHARSALVAAAQLGAPTTTALYFAADKDITTTTWPQVRDYLEGAASIVGLSRVGLYGERDVMMWAARDRVANWFFQTYAWSGANWWPGNHVEQYRNGVTLAGGTVDLCRAKVVNFGQWTQGGDVTAAEVWKTDGLVPAPSTRQDQTNEFWTPAAVLHDADDAARLAVMRTAELADRLLLIEAKLDLLFTQGGVGGATVAQIEELLNRTGLAVRPSTPGSGT